MSVLAALVGVVLTASGPKSSPRMDAIWDAVNSRISQQTDIWFEDGQFPMAIQLLRMDNAFQPQDYEVATNLGWMLENVEEWDLAVDTYRRYAASNPADPDAFLPEAQYWYRKKQFAKVPGLLEKRLSPKVHPNVYRILAHSYERLGKLQDSQRVWKTYIALYPKDLAAQNNLARVEKKLGGTGG